MAAYMCNSTKWIHYHMEKKSKMLIFKQYDF